MTFLGNAQEVIENYEKTGRQHKILLENAMNFLKNALEQSHENKGLKGKIYYQLGRIQFLKANYGRSREAFTKSLEVDPQEETKRHLALVFEALEKYEEAILLLTELSDESIQRENLCRVQAKMHEQVTRRRKIALESKFKEDVLSKRHLSVQKEDITLLNAYIPAEYIRDLPSWTFHPKDDELLLPMVFLYPPYGTFDILGQVSEYTFVLDHLEGMFEAKAPWDSKNLYTSSRGFRTFIPLVGASPNEILEVQKEMTFHEIFLKTKRATLFCGVFLLLVFPKDGATEDLSFFKITI